MLSSSCLRLLHLPAIFTIPSILPSITSYRRQFLLNMWPLQSTFLLFTVCGTFLSTLTLRIISSLLIRSVKVISPILLQHHIQNFPGISDLLSELFRFQHHTKLCSKCNTLLVSSLHLSPICRWKESSSCWMVLFHGIPGFNLTCTSCIICYYATH